MTIVNWLFIIVLFLFALAGVGLGILMFLLAPTGAGIAWGCVSILAGIGFGVGCGYLIKYTLSNPS